MKETIKTTGTVRTSHDSHTDINQAGKIGLGVVISFAGLVGAWGLACMLGALSTQGIGAVVKGFFTAVTGI